MAEEVGVGYVRLIPSMRGFARRAERQLRSGLAGPARKAGEDTGDQIGDGVDDRLGSRLIKSSKIAGKLLTAGLKPVAALAGAAFAAQFAAQVGAGLVSGVQAIGLGLGAGLALLPAAALAGALAFGTLKLAVLGVGDALSAGLTGDTAKFNEAIKGLAPSAQAFAKEVVGLKGGIDALKATVQENFFKPLVATVRPLGETYLPVATREMGLMARNFGQIGNSLVSFLTIPEIAQRIGVSLGFARVAVTNVASAFSIFVKGLVPLVTVGSTFLPQLTGGLDTAAVKFQQFMFEAERTGKLRDFIQSGVDAVRGLIATGKQVGRIFADIGSILSTVFSGAGLASGGLLDGIESLTGKLRSFVESAQGASVIGTVFAGIAGFIEHLRQPIERVFGIIADVVGPLLPKLGDFAAAFGRLSAAIINTRIDFLEVAFRGLAAVVGFVLPALTGLMNLLARNKPILQGIGIAILTFMVPGFVMWAISAGAAAIATLLAMAPLLLLGAAIAVFAALVIVHFTTIKNAFMTAFNWVRDNWPLLLVILTGPFGLAVVLIKTHWTTIVNAGKAVFNWVKSNWPLLLAILTGPFGIAVLMITRNWQSIKNGATAVKDWIRDRFNDVVSFVSGLPGRIASAASGMWDGITSAFKSAINTIIGWWNGLSFPSFSIPSADPLGSFGPSIGGGTFGGWSLPDIPKLHRGGVFRAPTPGGEGLAFLEDREGVLNRRQMADLNGSGGQAVGGVRVIVDMRGGEDEMMRLMRKRIRVEGGDVQQVLGQ